MIRGAPWEGVASDLATDPLRRSGGDWRARLAVRAPRGAVLAALWAAAVAAEALALRPVLFDRAGPIAGIEVVFSLVGFSFAACGLVAWRRRPVEIADDGVGGADDSRGTGLRGLADRVEALDGRLRVTSRRGRGTVVSAELPCVS